MSTLLCVLCILSYTFRANGPLRNLPEFAEQFSCPRGSFMNPGADRCTIL